MRLGSPSEAQPAWLLSFRVTTVLRKMSGDPTAEQTLIQSVPPESTTKKQIRLVFWVTASLVTSHARTACQVFPNKDFPTSLHLIHATPDNFYKTPSTSPRKGIVQRIVKMSNSEQDYKITVQQYSDEELLSKERAKRRRKTGDVIGTGLTAAAAIAEPALWAIAAGSAKSFMGNSSKHKIILREIERRGLTPLKGDISDTIMPLLGSAGSMAVGRAFGGAKGAGLGNMAGSLMRSASVRAFSGSSSKEGKKDKGLKRVFSPIDWERADSIQAQTASPLAMVPYSPSAAADSRNTGALCAQHAQHTLMTPTSYQVPRDQTPPATLVYHYYPPTPEYPRGYYAPAQPSTSAQQPSAPTVYQQPQIAPQATQQYLQPPPAAPTSSQMPPALAYQYAQPQPQYYHNAPQQVTYGNAPAYDAPPMYQPSIQRANTFHY